MARLGSILAGIHDDLEHYLPEESVLAAAREAGHVWRERQLGPVRTLHLFILQVLACNTAMAHLRHIAGEVFSLAAYCEARARLPLAALQALLRSSSQTLRQAIAEQHGTDSRWHGLRTFLVDGSSTITPDTPDLQKAFGQPTGQKPGCGFPVPKLLALFDAFTGMVVEMLGFPLFTHEQSKVWQLHPFLKDGDLLVGDRGFCSFVHLAMLQARGVKACFRCHQRQIIDFCPGRKNRDRTTGKDKTGQHKTGQPTSQFVKRLGKHDQIVRWKKPPHPPQWITPKQWDALPDWLEVREVRYTLRSNGQRTQVLTIATTLLDETLYTKADIAELYRLRWCVETRFSELKTTLKMRKLKSKTPDGVLKELAVYCLVYNMVRAVIAAAGLRQKVSPERISFIDALRWLLHATPGAPLPNLIVNPQRPNRHEPRVVKAREATYAKMTRPRSELRKELKIAGNLAK